MYFVFGAFAGVLGTVMSLHIRMELSYPSVQIVCTIVILILLANFRLRERRQPFDISNGSNLGLLFTAPIGDTPGASQKILLAVCVLFLIGRLVLVFATAPVPDRARQVHIALVLPSLFVLLTS